MTTRVKYGFFAPRAPGRVAGYTQRMRVYCSEMFPLPARLTTSILLYVSFTQLVCSVQGQETQWAWNWVLLGSFSGFLLALILRLMDELKDADMDRSLFPGRPVPSGRVRLRDIRVTLVIVCGLFLAIHVTAGAALTSALALLLYALLMFRYFYLAPRFKAKLLVNLATHNPVVPLLLFHFVVLWALQYEMPIRQWKLEILLVVGMYWALLLAWEVARKVRYPEEETAYQTYSRIFGPHRAAALAFSVQSLAVGIGLYLVYSGKLSGLSLLLLTAAYVWLIRGYARFLLRKVNSGVSLRMTAETFSALVMAVAPAESIFQMVKNHGLS
jgi:4-hydroxybenzoate polyprenyltransferase